MFSDYRIEKKIVQRIQRISWLVKTGCEWKLTIANVCLVAEVRVVIAVIVVNLTSLTTRKTTNCNYYYY